MTKKQKITLLVSLSLLIIVGGLFVIYNNFYTSKNLLNYCNCALDKNNKKNVSGASSEGTKAPTRYQVGLNKKAIKSEKIKKDDVLNISLCDGIKYKTKIDKVTQNVNGTKTIRGKIENNPQSFILINISGDKISIDLEVPDKNQRFVIQSNGNEDYLTDRSGINSDELQDKPALEPPGGSNPAPGNDPVPVPDAPAVINIMVVYTASARQWADANSTGIDNVIASAMEKAQLVNDNSGVGITMNLVHSLETDYVESGDSATDLVRITVDGDGYMDNIHDLRSQYGADLVSLLANVNDTGGISWLLGIASGNPASGFSLSRVQQTEWTYTFIHELGHNMGASHSSQQNFQPGPGLFDYSSGWRWTGQDNGQYCSIMTYEAGGYFADNITHLRVPYWSSPLTSYQGVATGDAADGDNARTVREIKSVISNYRGSPGVSIDIGRPSTIITDEGPASYIITYSNAKNITLQNSDITLNKTDTADGTIAVTGSGNLTRTVTITNITGSGTLGISLAAGTATNFEDVAGPAAGPSIAFTAGYNGDLLTLSPIDFTNGWNMVSFPDMGNGNTDDTLIPATDDLVRYNNGSNTYTYGNKPPQANVEIPLVPAAGYWLKIADVNAYADRNYVLNQVSPFEILVYSGWNLLGNPYQTIVPLNNLVVKYKNGTSQSFAAAVDAKKVYGYVWSWDKSINNYRFIAVYPSNYNVVGYPKQTFISPYYGFWLLVRSSDVASIIFNK